MNHIILPYYYNYTNTHFLKIDWIVVDNKRKVFLYYDRLFTIQIEYTKNNCKVLIHNTDTHHINCCTCTTIHQAITYINNTLAFIVNHYFFQDKYVVSTLHDVPLYQLYNFRYGSDMDSDYDLLCF